MWAQFRGVPIDYSDLARGMGALGVGLGRALGGGEEELTPYQKEMLQLSRDKFEFEKSQPQAVNPYMRGPDGSVTFTPGGPADPDVIKRNAAARSGVDKRPVSIPPETRARLALSRKYLDDYSAPNGLRDRIKSGKYTGVQSPLGAMGVGAYGDINARQESGVDALIRHLTGAGMAIAEAQKYAQRYSLQWNDSDETALTKADRLATELEYMEKTIMDPTKRSTVVRDANGEVMLGENGLPMFEGGGPKADAMSPDDAEASRANAAAAIAQRPDLRDQIIQRLEEAGIDTSGL